ncbi:MAG: polysaccharide deacetylase [Alicyclobacillaceae bacterium]|nr:polysaccharide deacetylase [Alicyclobacillaceae bacterium]
MWRSMMRATWQAFEHLFHWAFRLKPIQPGEEHLFYVAKRRYYGRQFQVDDIVVHRFDKVVELHMNNDMIADILSTETEMMPIVLRLLKEANRSVSILARLLEEEEFRDANAIYGITFIHRGIRRFGLHAIPLQTGILRSITRWHLKNVFRMVNPNADEILKNHMDVFEPKLVAASRARFVARHGVAAGSAAVAEQSVVADHVLS